MVRWVLEGKEVGILSDVDGCLTVAMKAATPQLFPIIMRLADVGVHFAFNTARERQFVWHALFKQCPEMLGKVGWASDEALFCYFGNGLVTIDYPECTDEQARAETLAANSAGAMTYLPREGGFEMRYSTSEAGALVDNLIDDIMASRPDTFKKSLVDGVTNLTPAACSKAAAVDAFVRAHPALDHLTALGDSPNTDTPSLSHTAVNTAVVVGGKSFPDVSNGNKLEVEDPRKALLILDEIGIRIEQARGA